MQFPDELRYSTEHEWVAVDGVRARIGITDYAQDALGDVVYVDLPDVGLAVIAGSTCAEVESTKSVSEIYSPLSGVVVEVNQTLDDAPEQINQEPYGTGWIFAVEMSDTAELDGAPRRGRVPQARRGGVAIPSWRLLDELGSSVGAEEQMESDTALLARGRRRCAPGVASATGGRRPTLSLGRFQSDDEVDHDACRRLGVAVVRRPTGGRRCCTAPISRTPSRSRGPRARPVRSTRSTARSPARSIAGLARLGVEAAIARHDRAGRGGARRRAGPVCFTSMQGADLRVGDRKLCGSAQVRRGGAVLQHGSILLDRLAFDETSLLAPRPGQAVPGSDDLRRVTVTMRELGAPHDPQVVAAALVEGFRETLDVEFT